MDNAHNRNKCRSLTQVGNRPTLSQCGNEGVILYGLCSRVLVISIKKLRTKTFLMRFRKMNENLVKF